jgi:hypothetical protein
MSAGRTDWVYSDDSSSAFPNDREVPVSLRTATAKSWKLFGDMHRGLKFYSYAVRTGSRLYCRGPSLCLGPRRDSAAFNNRSQACAT